MMPRIVSKSHNAHMHKTKPAKQKQRRPQESTACSLPSAGDRSNIILGVPRSNHKERGKFKDNVIKRTIWVKKKSTLAW